jgi:pSer/pThr/pTyr-binding forkhead associated (FHA) protein
LSGIESPSWKETTDTSGPEVFGHRALELILWSREGSRTFALDAAGVYVIGQGVGATIHITESTVSRQHVRIDVGDELFVTDLGSTNGTSVN